MKEHHKKAGTRDSFTKKNICIQKKKKKEREGNVMDERSWVWTIFHAYLLNGRSFAWKQQLHVHQNKPRNETEWVQMKSEWTNVKKEERKKTSENEMRRIWN